MEALTMRKEFLFSALALVVLFLTITTVGAANFSVYPMKLEMAKGVRTAEVHIKNHDTKPVRFTIRVTDDDNAPAKDVAYFPRAMELAPGEQRIVRVGIKALTAKERRYFVLVNEVRSDPANTAQGAAAHLLLQISIPVTVPGAK